MTKLLDHDRLAVLFAILLLIDFAYGLRTGKSILFFRSYKKGEHPYLYWASIAMSGIVAVILLVIFLPLVLNSK